VGTRDILSGSIAPWTGLPYLQVSFGEFSLQMVGAGTGQWVSRDGRFTLSLDGTIYTLTAPDGTLATFDANIQTLTPGMPQGTQLTSVTKPNGERLTYTYVWHATSAAQNCCYRLQAVTSNLGYMMKYQYAGAPGQANSRVLTKVTAINLAYEYCDPAAESCSLTQPWSEVTYTGDLGFTSWTDPGGGTVTAKDALNRTTRYQLTVPGGSTPPTMTATSPAGVQTSMQGVPSFFGTFQSAAGAWSYNWQPTGGYQDPVYGSIPADHMTVTDPLGHAREVVFEHGFKHVVAATDERGKTTRYSVDPNTGRVSRITRPEGDYTDYQYDSRGNIIQVTEVAKAGSGLANRVSTASYPATCSASTAKTCNKPTSVTANGATTDYTWDPNSGEVATATGPAGANGVRPQTRYTYLPFYAWYLSAPGILSPAPTPVYRLREVSSCMTQTSCTGTADEAKTTYDYGSTGQPNNLLLTATTASAGDGSLSATTQLAYDIQGNVISSDGPLAGTVDKAYFRYDRERQRIGDIGPDPDGAGGRPNAATRTNYNPDGAVGWIDHGTVAGPSDADWAGLAIYWQETFSYDAAGRLLQQALQNGSRLTLTDFSYDAANRRECRAVRMNPAVFAAAPTPACTLGPAGAFGQDRISKTQYDAAGNAISLTTALGTPAAATEQRTYSDNGRLKTEADGNGNLTTYEYDGFDRLSKTRYPDAANGAASSTTDFTQLTYDPTTGRVSQERLRDGQTNTYTRDARGNVTAKTLPVSTTYSVDNLNRMRTASANGQTITNVYDALGRRTSSAGPLGTFSYQYDLADERTRLTWPDGFYVTYDRDNTGAVTGIRENGSTLLVQFGYDNLGQRQTLTRLNGVTTTYSYDTAQRLGSLTHDLPGTASDQSLGFQYNPADQIQQRTSTNGIYDWNGLYSQDRGYGINGLNQLTSNAGVAIAYDTRGNLYSDGTRTYGYDAANRLTSTSAGGTLAYDPVDRLYQATSGGGTATRFAYDGADMVGEYDGSNILLRRYVHGPWSDEPLVQYDGAGTGTRRWLVADQQGTVVAITDGAGSALNINRYDEYGVPDQANQGRFQYTGQMYLPEVGLYHYKARAYSATLGRFMQTDPGDYADGLNTYAYVHGDPVNGIDPSGLIEELIIVGVKLQPYQLVDIPTGRVLARFSLPVLSVSIHPPALPVFTSDSTGGKKKTKEKAKDRRARQQQEARDRKASQTGGEPDTPPPPKDNQAQNKMVNDAARDAGLTAEEREKLGRTIEEFSRELQHTPDYQMIRGFAEEIRLGRFGSNFPPP
jgi:RHS repeat-associated protein